MLASEEGCRRYLFSLRWPNGFKCPRCGGSKAWAIDGLMHCANCKQQTSVTAGTIFHRTHQPLRVWFRAIWWVTSQKTGVSALGLQRVLGLGSYRTAWTMLHKLRRAMVRSGRERLSGRVEVDEAFVGSPEPGRHGRRLGKKALVVVAAEEDGSGTGRIRMRCIPNGKAEHLHAFIAESIEPGSVIHTDGWQGYASLESLGYRHEVSEIVASRGSASDLLPRVHRAISLLKRWMLGTHQGSVSHEHLDYYLDEFVFRFNRRSSRHRGQLFHRLVQQAVTVDPVPYRALVHGSRNQRRNHNR